MTEQPIEPRERDDEPDPSTTTPHPDPQPDPDDNTPEVEALSGSDVGSDTRAGSLQGGAATGSERDPAQVASDRHLADIGEGLRRTGTGGSVPSQEPEPGVANTGAAKERSGAPGDNADAATG